MGAEISFETWYANNMDIKAQNDSYNNQRQYILSHYIDLILILRSIWSPASIYFSPCRFVSQHPLVSLPLFRRCWHRISNFPLVLYCPVIITNYQTDSYSIVNCALLCTLWQKLMKTLVSDKSGCIDVRLITLNSNPQVLYQKYDSQRRPASIVLVVMVLYGSESSHSGVNFGKSTRKLSLYSVCRTLQRLDLCVELNERGVPMSDSLN